MICLFDDGDKVTAEELRQFASEWMRSRGLRCDPRTDWMLDLVAEMIATGIQRAAIRR